MPNVSFGRFEFVFLATFDLGYLLSEKTRNGGDRHVLLFGDSYNGEAANAPLRTRLFSALRRSVEPPPLGSFIDGHDERLELQSQTRTAIEDRGKQIFTQHFLDFETPLVWTFERAGSYLLPPQTPQNVGTIARKEAFAIGTRDLTYTASSLRLFRNGVLGLELRFRFENEKLPLSTEDLISTIVALESRFCLPATYAKFRSVLDTLHEGVLGELLGDAAFLTRPCELERFHSLASYHRFIVADLVLLDGKPLSVETDTKILLVRQQLAGVLNRATWFDHYTMTYVDNLMAKGIAFQNDELFLTDGGSTFIYLPLLEKETKKRYIVESILCLSHYLLSWEALTRFYEDTLECTASSFEKLRGRLSPGKRGGAKSKALAADIAGQRDHLATMFEAVSLLRAGFSVRSLVQHGFSAKVLSQFCLERRLSQAVDDVSSRIEAVARVLDLRTHDAGQELGLRQTIRYATFAIWIAAIVGALQLLMPSFCSARGRAAAKPAAAATESLPSSTARPQDRGPVQGAVSQPGTTP